MGTQPRRGREGHSRWRTLSDKEKGHKLQPRGSQALRPSPKAAVAFKEGEITAKEWWGAEGHTLQVACLCHSLHSRKGDIYSAPLLSSQQKAARTDVSTGGKPPVRQHAPQSRQEANYSNTSQAVLLWPVPLKFKRKKKSHANHRRI